LYNLPYYTQIIVEAEKEVMMNNKENDIPSAAEKQGPSVGAFVIIALIGAASGALSYSLGVLMMLLYSVVTVFLASAKAPMLLQALLVPAGLVPLYFRDAELTYVMLTVWLCSVVGGVVIALGGRFHVSVMAYSFTGFLSAIFGGIVYMQRNGLTVEFICGWVENTVREFMEQMLAAAGDTVPYETARLFAQQYDAIAKSAAAYIPGVVGGMIVLFATAAVILSGILHNITGCKTYRFSRRIPKVDKIYAVLWLASLLVGVIDGGIAGVCASNIMMALMIPCSVAGLTEYKVMLIKRKLMKKRGLPFAIITLIVVFIFVSPVVGVMVLSLTGAFGAFVKESVIAIKK